MATQAETAGGSTARVKADNARIDRLKEQLLSTPQALDNERVRIMAEVYEKTAGYQQIIRRAKFFEQLIERKKLYIDENIIVGSMASSVCAVYTYPEWNVRVDEGRRRPSRSRRPRKTGRRTSGRSSTGTNGRCGRGPTRSSSRSSASIRTPSTRPASSRSSCPGRVAAAT